MAPRRPRPVLRLLCVFLAVSIAAALGAGTFLATHLDIYPYLAFARGYPGSFNNLNKDSALINQFFVRTRKGARFGRPVDRPDWPMAEGVVLGSAQCEFQMTATGFPNHTTIEWTIGSISNIAPTADGPPASDHRAWHDIVTEACDRIYYGYTLPAALRAGADHVVTHHPWKFTLNVLWWIAHALLWLGSCLLIAAIIASADFAVTRKSRRRAAGLCPHCAYDRFGLAPNAVCPECGRVA